jgi:hypothetical protein
MIRIIGEDMIDATCWTFKRIAYETDLGDELPKKASSSKCSKSLLRKR